MSDNAHLEKTMSLVLFEMAKKRDPKRTKKDDSRNVPTRPMSGVTWLAISDPRSDPAVKSATTIPKRADCVVSVYAKTRTQ
jgi:hypothetical protein